MTVTVYQFTTLVFGNLPQILAFITGLVILWRQRVNAHETKAAIASTSSDTLSAVANVHQQINGRMDQLIATTKSDSHAEGMRDQKQETADEKIIVGHNEIH